ncbi:D-mannonate oxidoreductase [Salegentibacter salinarum]|uniref:D-mannonate oxidoreductase n=1 Tax=Salegentibacter salinarum TaxID=447422 RepID=A0A2N0TNY3_9FLAO|nr:SDR family oxidoreductase [Salegentibacter salinarum]PKD16447.1 D-mannonate oxidoreductase [Salegentibacter salinarum]SKB64434.1 NAD(P)-dependent dehydrogenase, short-chain alcohol dehydrogenase family [Salegentibacter salinarum]
MFNLDGKTAIITGGNGVLGGAMAHGLAAQGVKVGILGRSTDTVEKRVKEIEDAGGTAMSLVADVLDRKSLEEAKDKVLKAWGTIDILINGAGGNMKGATIGPDQNFFDLSLDDFSKVNDLNFKGTVLPTYVFAKPMADAKKGSIINISSMAAQQAITRVLGYSAAKAAVDNFTKWLAVEMAQKYGGGIRVNAVAPGFFIGEQNRDLLLNKDKSLTARGETIVSNTPMKRFGEAEELQGVTNWLASDAASFVTGIVVPVDGGFSAFSGV